MLKITLLISIYNEAPNLPILFEELAEVEKSLGHKYLFNLLCVNDGSTDETKKILVKLQKKFKNLQIYSLRKNYGKSMTYLVGFEKASGDIIVTLDADLQDDPSQIPLLIDKIEQGYDLVVGWRKRRKDEVQKRLSSFFWNKLLSFITKINLHDANCGIKAIRRKVLTGHFFQGDFHRYLPIVLGMEGFKVAEVEVRHRKRLHGSSKYNYWRFFSGFFDFLTTIFLMRYSMRPMHFFGIAGIVLLLIGLVIDAYLTILKISGQAIGGRPLLILGVLLIISGFQFIMTGFIADLIVKRDSPKPVSYISSIIE